MNQINLRGIHHFQNFPVAPVIQKKFLPTVANHRPQSPCAPWDKFWVSKPSCRPSAPAQSVPVFEIHEEKRDRLR